MKLIIYSFPNCQEARKIREFLQNNNLQFREITINNKNLNEIKKLSYQDKISFLKIIKNHSIEVMVGFNDWHLNQLIEQINKYHPKIEI